MPGRHKELKDKHVTREGIEMLISDMTDSHLQNTIKFIERRAKEGVKVLYGGSGPDISDMWCEEDTLFGEDALEVMKYGKYVKERENRRKREREILADNEAYLDYPEEYKQLEKKLNEGINILEEAYNLIFKCGDRIASADIGSSLHQDCAVMLNKVSTYCQKTRKDNNGQKPEEIRRQDSKSS